METKMPNLNIPRQAETETGAGDEADTGAKKGVAIHELLAADGSVTKRMEEAVGIRYTLRDLPDSPFTFNIPGAQAGSAATMLAIFGAKTKATNEASRIRNAATNPGGADEQLSAVDEVFEQLEKGVWREKAEGTGGSRIDRAKLAQALVNVLGEKARKTVGEYQAQLEESDDYFKQVRLHPEVRAEYTRLVGKAVADVSTLA
jgi:hypothetical protein